MPPTSYKHLDALQYFYCKGFDTITESRWYICFGNGLNPLDKTLTPANVFAAHDNTKIVPAILNTTAVANTTIFTANIPVPANYIANFYALVLAPVNLASFSEVLAIAPFSATSATPTEYILKFNFLAS